MLNFKSVSIDDKKWITPILKKSGHCSSEFAFGTIYIWCNGYSTKVCKRGDFLIRAHDVDNRRYYSFPVGTGDLRSIMLDLAEDSRSYGDEFRLLGLTKNMIKEIESCFPNRFEYKERRDMYDYIYNCSDLATLPGKKYHSKRNHISKFKRTYNWKYENISEKNIHNCEKIVYHWLKSKNNGTPIINAEQIAIKRAIENYYTLKLKGGILFSDEKPIAFTICEEINEQAALIHFEKALTEYDGAYAMINCEFVKNNLLAYKYVNREEDMGIPQLRKAKLSYKPAIILEKFEAIMKY